MNMFCALNGYRLESAVDDAVELMLAVAAGETDEEALVEWLSTHLG